MKIFPIETGNFKLDGGAMFGVVPKVMWEKSYPADENNLCNWAMRSLLIDDGKNVVLIDAGIGDKQSEKFFSYYYLNGDDTLLTSLEKAGYLPGDITHIIITHLHFDHCGGVISKDNNGQLIPTFPNAEIIVSKKQWEWAINPNNREKASFLSENILPMEFSGKLKLIDKEGEILPNISLLMFHGHTDGQIVPVIRGKDFTIAYGADLIPSTEHVPLPYIMSYDTRPLKSIEDKKRFYDLVLDSDWIIFLEHDLYNECCSLKQGAKSVIVKQKGILLDFI